MRIALAILTLVAGAPAAASIVVHAVGAAASVGSLAAALPNPSTAAIMVAGLGLVATARRGRSGSLAA